MSREEMVEYIKNRLETACTADIENVYWLIEMEFAS